MTAISDGICKLLKPEIAWPEVQPPAYGVPNPIKNPPINKTKNPFTVNAFSKLNKASGPSFP